MASAMVALANLTLGSAQASVTFASIPTSGYRDLRLVMTGTSVGNPDLTMRINGDTGSNYYRVFMQGTGSSAGSSSATETAMQVSSNSVWLTSNQSNLLIDFMDSSATDKHKSVLIRFDNSALGTSATAGRWGNTTAITSIQLLGSSFATGTTFSLYGVSA